MIVARGELWWASLDPIVGSEQAGRRPVLIFQNDAVNSFTTTMRRSQLPSSVFVPSADTGLPCDSVALCHQMRVLDKTRLDGRIGVLPADLLRQVEYAVGSPWAFIGAVVIVVMWFAGGPYFQWSDTYQLIINTGTTIITFLMVFLIQKAQNKDSLAIQLKLNELVAAHEFASNRLVNVENMSEEDLSNYFNSPRVNKKYRVNNK